MGLTIIGHRESGDDVRYLKSLLRKTKENLAEICDMVDTAEVEMRERGDYGEHDGYRERSRYRRDDDSMLERRRY